MAARRKISHKKYLEQHGWHGNNQYGYYAPKHLQAVYWRRYTMKQAVKIQKEQEAT